MILYCRQIDCVLRDNGGVFIEDAIPIPDGQVARKQLHFFWLADCSDSMRGKKIATLNQAIREALPEVQKAVAGYPQVDYPDEGNKILQQCIMACRS